MNFYNHTGLRITLIIFICFYNLLVFSQKYKITISISNYSKDTLFINNFYGSQEVHKDTIIASEQGQFVWAQENRPLPGVYILKLVGDKNPVQFLVNEMDNFFTIRFDAKNLFDIRFENSQDNSLFYEYLAFIKSKKITRGAYMVKVERAKNAGNEDVEANQKIASIDQEVRSYQDRIMEEYPSYLTAMLVKSNVDIIIPDFQGTEEEVKLKRYNYYKTHFFDNIDMSNHVLLRTPFLFQKIDYYLNRVSSQHPDSLIQSIDFVLGLFENNPETHRYYLVHLMNKYADLKLPGQDIIYVHLVDRYYTEEKAYWLSADHIAKLKQRADFLRPTLSGRILPNVTTFTEDNKAVVLDQIESEYTIVYLYDPTCSNCKEASPHIVDFYQKNKDKNVQVLTICNSGGDKTKLCWPYIKEQKMEALINTGDMYQGYNQIWRIEQFPKIMILGKNKEIIIKDILATELDHVFDEIIKMDAQKTNK